MASKVGAAADDRAIIRGSTSTLNRGVMCAVQPRMIALSSAAQPYEQGNTHAKTSSDAADDSAIIRGTRTNAGTDACDYDIR